MLIGHYGVSFALKRADPRIPLWVTLVVAQLPDILFGLLVV